MCYLDITEYDNNGFFFERHVTARKTHTCSSCRRTIQSKEKYVRHFNAYDGHAMMEKLCADCEADRATFAKAHDGIIVTPSGRVHFLDECIDRSRYEPDENPEKWVKMKRRILARSPQLIQNL